MYFWWCCIAATEKLVLAAMAENFLLTLGSPIPKITWDALWATAPWGSAERAAAGQRSWGLFETEIVIPDEPPIPAIGYADIPAWIAFSAFFITPAATCPDGCTQPDWL